MNKTTKAIKVLSILVGISALIFSLIYFLFFVIAGTGYINDGREDALFFFAGGPLIMGFIVTLLFALCAIPMFVFACYDFSAAKKFAGGMYIGTGVVSYVISAVIYIYGIALPFMMFPAMRGIAPMVAVAAVIFTVRTIVFSLRFSYSRKEIAAIDFAECFKNSDFKGKKREKLRKNYLKTLQILAKKKKIDEARRLEQSEILRNLP